VAMVTSASTRRYSVAKLDLDALEARIAQLERVREAAARAMTEADLIVGDPELLQGDQYLVEETDAARLRAALAALEEK